MDRALGLRPAQFHSSNAVSAHDLRSVHAPDAQLLEAQRAVSRALCEAVLELCTGLGVVVLQRRREPRHAARSVRFGTFVLYFTTDTGTATRIACRAFATGVQRRRFETRG